MIKRINIKLNRSLIRKTIKNTNKGLSLIEILISLTILGFAATFITTRVMESLHEGQVRSSRIQMHNLARALEEFRRHCGVYPTTEQGLDALVQKPAGGKPCRRYQDGGYIQGGEVPFDPWENPYDYKSEGSSFELQSFGANGMDGGEGKDKNIPMKEKREDAGE